MRSSLRRGQRRDTGSRSASKALTVLGNLLLVLATVAVGLLVAYLVINPPGVVESSDLNPLPTGPTSPSGAAAGGTTTGQTAPPEGPATSGVPGQLSLDTACGAINPLLDRADEIRTTAIDNSDALVPESISDLTRDLETLANASPPELSAVVDPLTQILVDLNNEVLAGREFPEVDSSGAEQATATARELCAQA